MLCTRCLSVHLRLVLPLIVDKHSSLRLGCMQAAVLRLMPCPLPESSASLFGHDCHAWLTCLSWARCWYVCQSSRASQFDRLVQMRAVIRCCDSCELQTFKVKKRRHINVQVEQTYIPLICWIYSLTNKNIELFSSCYTCSLVMFAPNI